MVLTDHQALESWVTEVIECISGMSGRRARWHMRLSRFKIVVCYIPGKLIVVADALSRWAYPASLAFLEVSWHGSKEDDVQPSVMIGEEMGDGGDLVARETTGSVVLPGGEAED